MTDEAQDHGAVLTFRADGKSGKGDSRLTLDADSGDVQAHEDSGALYAPVMLPDGTEARLTLRRNVYAPRGEGIESLTFRVTVDDVQRTDVAGSAGSATVASDIMGLIMDGATGPDDEEAIAALADELADRRGVSKAAQKDERRAKLALRGHFA